MHVSWRWTMLEFMFRDECGFSELAKIKIIYVWRQIDIFQKTKKKTVCLKIEFSIKEMKSSIKCIWKTWRANSGLEEQVMCWMLWYDEVVPNRVWCGFSLVAWELTICMVELAITWSSWWVVCTWVIKRFMSLVCVGCWHTWWSIFRDMMNLLKSSLKERI